MNRFHSKTLHLLASLVLISSTVLFSHQAIAGSSDDQNNGAAMVADLVLARPIGLIATVLGSAVFIASLPFTLLGGNADAAAVTLVIEPAKFTFFRPLGG